MKIILIALALVVFVGGGIYLYQSSLTTDNMTGQNDETVSENGRVMNDETEEQNPPANTGKLKAANFSGKLEEVNTGCFADGECYVVVDGKHITVLMGWSRDTVGSVQGVEGIGDLEAHIGSEVEVYAQDMSDGTYTLYGSEGFYVKLK